MIRITVGQTVYNYEGRRSKIEFFTPRDTPYGLTYGQWTVKWWHWALSIPKKNNPLLDDIGCFADVGQNGPVWFIAGTFGENKLPRRVCTVPSSKAVLFPVINYEADVIQDPELVDEIDLIEHVSQDMDDIITKEAVIDGKNVSVFRVKSDPPVFPVTLGIDNPISLPSGIINVAADGYWVFLKPLNCGEHQIYFHGACSGGTRNSKAKYKLMVVK
jgi:hypothetical protein